MQTLPTAARPARAEPFPLAQADQCVKCGMCLPHCPTYMQTRHEGDSPRGRIALMQGLATGMIPQTAKLEEHLDGCLSCRACEAVCPAQVPYGHLIDAGRSLLAPQRPQEMRRMRFIGYWLTNRTARRMAGVLLWLYQRLGLQFLLRRTRLLGHGPLARLESLLPAVTLPWRLRARNPVRFDKLTANGKYQTETVRPEPVEGQSQQQSKVALFTGCTGELADRQTLEDAIHVLNRIGVSVEVPAAQGCCGALHQHAGLNAEARKLLANNLRAFGDDGAPILSPASGCGAALMEYPQIAGVEFRASAVAFAGRVLDLNAFLLAHWPANLALKPLHARILVHTPCTLRNVMKKAGAVTSL
ncbi:MAG: (Fe-S)-binding protein, partial [Stenotrophobium sp.]